MIRYNERVIISFADQATEDIYHGSKTRLARQKCPEQLWLVAQRKLDLLNAAVSLDSLRSPPGNRLEVLAGDRKGQHSIRINRQFRICFVWLEHGVSLVEIVDYH